MRTCSKCKLDLDESQFNKIGKNKDGSQKKQSYCKSCKKKVWDIYYQNKDNKDHHLQRNRNQTRQKKIGLRDFLDSLKQDPCLDCGIKYPPYVMDFDHTKDDKYENVSHMVSNKRSREDILNEVKKCDLVCSNCHRARTYKRYKYKYK